MNFLTEEQLAELERQHQAAESEWLSTERVGPAGELLQFKSVEYVGRLLRDVRGYRRVLQDLAREMMKDMMKKDETTERRP